MGAADLVRAVNNGYIQADATGFLQWPLTAAIPEGLIYSNRGLVTADEPQSGYYYVDRLTWATAQTTQFARPGWRYVLGASGQVGDSGSYVTYESPDHHNWSLVAQNTGSWREQLAAQAPIFWQLPEAGPPTPYAIVGSKLWTDYTVSANVSFSSPDGSAGLIGRFNRQAVREWFNGYELDLNAIGAWALTLNSRTSTTPATLASGQLHELRPDTWHALALSFDGTQITASIDGRQVAALTNTAYSAGIHSARSSPICSMVAVVW